MALNETVCNIKRRYLSFDNVFFMHLFIFGLTVCCLGFTGQF